MKSPLVALYAVLYLLMMQIPDSIGKLLMGPDQQLTGSFKPAVLPSDPVTKAVFDPVMKGFDCLRAPSATNGGDVTVSAIQLTTLGLEGTLTLTCAPGYTASLSSPTAASCSLETGWSVAPRCDPVQCTVPASFPYAPSLANCTLGESVNVHTACMFNCEAGPDMPSVCQADGNFADPNCGKICNNGLTSDKAATSCNAVRQCIGPSMSAGLYWIAPSGGGTQQAYCSVDEGGGWTLILESWHKGGNDISVNQLYTFPNLHEGTLGDSANRGVARSELLSKIPFTEIRFFCETPIGVSYIKTGTGSFSGLASSYTELTGHYSAKLPAVALDFSPNHGNRALLYSPFRQNSNLNLWHIADNNVYCNTGSGESRDMHHRVWVK